MKLFSRACSTLSKLLTYRPVSTGPGESALHRIPCLAWSSAIARAIFIKPPFAPQYHGRPGRATRPSCDATKMILPPPSFSISGIACLQNKKELLKLTSINLLQSSALISVNGTYGISIIALLTSTLSPPNFSTANLMAASAALSSATSAVIAIASPPDSVTCFAVSLAVSSLISKQSTAAPSLAKSRQIARPIPPPAPVTIAFLFSKRIINFPP